MRDRTPRDAPIAARPLLATRQPVALAQPVGLAGALADEDLAAFVVAKEFLAERADRDQPVRPGAIERGEQAKAGDAGDPSGEGGADMGRHIGRDITIHGAAFGGDGAPLAHRKVLAELGEAALVGVGTAMPRVPKNSRSASSLAASGWSWTR